MITLKKYQMNLILFTAMDTYETVYDWLHVFTPYLKQKTKKMKLENFTVENCGNSDTIGFNKHPVMFYFKTHDDERFMFYLHSHIFLAKYNTMMMRVITPSLLWKQCLENLKTEVHKND